MGKMAGLRRRKGEAEWMHRGLLLWAMQSPDNFETGILGRSLRAIGRTMDRSAPTVMRWKDKHDWIRRVLHHGDEAEQVAAELYRRLYLEEHGKADLPRLAHLISVQVTVDAATEVQAEAAKVLSEVLDPGEDPPPSPDPVKEKDTQSAVDKQRKRAAQENQVLQGLARKALVKLGAALDAGEVRLSVGDIPKLATLLSGLRDEEFRLQNPDVGGSSVVPDSARVRLAKEHGQDVTEAIIEDLEELLVVTRAVRSTAEQDAERAKLQLVEEQAG